MSKIVIFENERFRLTSFGNGLSYVLLHKQGCRDVFVQGDDATAFRAEFETWAGMSGATYASAAENIWIDYACISEPVEKDASK